MCIGCGGKCKGGTRAQDGPRFTRPPGGPDLRVVGTSNGPTEAPTVPDSVVRRTPGGLLTYEDLYTGLGPDNKPALLIAPGTFGTYAQRAGRA
ncbi:hypothetical protein [Streptomyces collinus]|uniref:Uncharacterized protein n=1 Tax=Streptomyces collinus (strain DSM 40733 / Tue 365) TaxID=1214242 RepID=S5W1I6_STRC3|nr:hypothetical protein [Streptomyces collinus]AGS73940.1 hypothetical protein B446_35908 [Streptomyces collinus Tu 365]